MNEIEFTALIQKASKFLKQRDRTSSEVRSFFISRGYNSSIIEQLIVYMQKIGLINDTKFMDNFIENQIQKGFGKLAIFEKLKRFGFTENQISEKLNSLSNHIWIQSCEQQISCSRKSATQIFQSLVSRGFEVKQIQMAFKNLNIPILRDEFYESV